MYICIGKNLTRSLMVAALALCLGTGLVFSRASRQTQPVASYEWGLHFEKPSTAPVPNLSDDKLNPYNAYYHANPDMKKIYITFDAGYENGHTTAILDALKKHNATAVFFLVGPYIEDNPDLVKRMVAEGHTVGNHTLHHPDMSAISDPASFRSELQGLEDLYEKTVGKPLPKYYRPPQGTFSEENLKQAKALGYKTIFWSLAYVDWNNNSQPDPKESIEKLCARIHPGAVVLLHSTSQTNARILDELLTKWKDMGYSFITLEELTAS